MLTCLQNSSTMEEIKISINQSILYIHVALHTIMSCDHAIKIAPEYTCMSRLHITHYVLVIICKSIFLLSVGFGRSGTVYNVHPCLWACACDECVSMSCRKAFTVNVYMFMLVWCSPVNCQLSLCVLNMSVIICTLH